MSSFNFMLKLTGNYTKVEESIFFPIGDSIKVLNHSVSFEYEYILNSINFVLFFGRNGDVFMSHGVADKNYLLRKDDEEGLAINKYKALFVPGPWLKNKILLHPDNKLLSEQIYCVGWPRLDALVDQQKIYNKNKDKNTKETLKVLWAPTHDARKHGKKKISTSSYPAFEKFIPLLNEKVDLNISLHPRNRQNKTPTGNALYEADVVIADFGTTVYEAWGLGIPVIFPHWILGKGVMRYRPGSAEAYIFENKIGYHPDSIEELLALLEKDLKIENDVVSFMSEYLPREFLGKSSEMCAKYLIQLANN